MPRTLAQNAQYIAETIKPAIKSAIEAQGVTVPSTDSFLDYADRIGEIEGGGSGYQLKDLPTGSISTVTDAAELPLNALKVSVEAWQEGSGDPSPSNVRPIHGWDSGKISVVGKNWVKQVIIGWIDAGNNSVKVDNDAETVLFFANQGVKYTVSSQSTFNRNVLAQVDADNVTQGTPVYNITNHDSYTWEALWTGWTVWYVKASRDAVIEQTAQVEIGTQATTYEPYQGSITTLDFPQTIYGAEWDVINGELGLKITDGFYSSYNGETLPGIWMSDRDVYQEGTTPTIGAQVKYKLATPTYVTLTPLSIRLLEGTNNLYADCGEVIEGEYFVDEGAHRYQLYDYIESDGTQCIDLGVKLNANDVVKCIYVPLSGMTNWNWLWIAEDTNTSKFSGVVFMSSSQMADYDYSVESNRRSWTANQISESSLTASAAINANVKFSDGAIVKLYSFSINDNFYLPAKRKSDGVFGLYDVTNQTFLTDSAGGNAFVGGNPIGVGV